MSEGTNAGPGQSPGPVALTGSVDVVLALAGLAIWFGAFPPGTLVVDAIPPVVGVGAAVLFGLGALGVVFVVRRLRHGRDGRTAQ